MGVLTCFLIFPNPQWGQNLLEVDFVIFQIILSNFNFNILFSNLVELSIRLLLFQRFDERVNLLPHLPESTVGPKKKLSRNILKMLLFIEVKKC